MKTIPLSQGQIAIVDDCDFGTLIKYKWSAHWSPIPRMFYAHRSETIDGKHRTILMHRQILGINNPRIYVAHWDHHGLNNQRLNLIDCTMSQYHGNQRKLTDCTSKYKGVCWDKRIERWLARIYVNGKHKYLGTFRLDQELQAAEAYNRAALEHFGEFAYLNVLP